MNLGMLADNGNTRHMTNIFMGYNHNPVIGDGEFYDTKNLSSDHYPLMAPRKPRKLAKQSSIEWSDSEITKVKTELSEHEGRVYADIYYACGGVEERVKFGVKLKATYVPTSTFIVNRAEIIAERKYFTPSGVQQTETVCIESQARKTSYTFEFEQTQMKDPDSLYLHVYGYFSTDDRQDAISVVLKKNVGIIRGFTTYDGKLAYMVGETLYYEGWDRGIDFSSYIDGVLRDKTSEVQIIVFNNQFLIFPLNLYADIQMEPYTWGKLGFSGTYNATFSFKPCDANGNAINATVSPTAPSDPKNKDYWIDSSQNAMYQWSADMQMWMPVTSNYTLFESSVELWDAFAHKRQINEGDTVFIKCNQPDGMNLENGVFVKKVIGPTKLVLSVLCTSTYSAANYNATIERKIPKMDYVTVCNNRVFGCFRGYVSNYPNGSVMHNEIYACKLGDPTNWYTYQGISTDSYALSLGDGGDFTGAVTYNGCPMFFKENVIYRIYGSYPAAFQLITYNCRGCQKGSGKSIALVGEFLMYKSAKDICVFNGEFPSVISPALGEDVYDKASAGVSLDKYYLSMRRKEDGIYSQFVYDSSTGIWMKEDDIEITQYASTTSGTLYGLSGNDIVAIAYDDEDLDEYEDKVEWMGITGEINYDFPDRTYVDRLTIRASIPYGSEINTFVSYDGKSFVPLKTVRGDSTVGTQSFAFVPKRCDHFRLKFEGHGDVRIYSVTRNFSYGSEKGNDNR